MIPVLLAKYLIYLFPLFLVYLLLQKKIRVVVTAVIAGLTAKLLEMVVGYFYVVPRPFVVSPDLPYYQDVAEGLLSDSSFFSAHAATAFAIAAVVYLTYSRRSGMILFLLSGLIAVGRVLANVHYPIDVLAGAVVGCITGLTVSNLCAKLLK